MSGDDKYIISIPLTIQDSISGSIIKHSKINLLNETTNAAHTESSEVLVTGICQEGSFQGKITKNQLLSDLESHPGLKYTKESIFEKLFPTSINQYESAFDDLNLHLTAKHVSSSQNYKPDTKELLDTEDMLLVSENVVISIKTKDKLPRTVASFELQYLLQTSSDSTGHFDYMDLFNWMDLLIKERNTLASSYAMQNKTIRKLKSDIDTLEEQINTASEDNSRILRDYEDKFYQVLNAKKKRILELEGPYDHNNLQILNRPYMDKNKLNLLNKAVSHDHIPEELNPLYKARVVTRSGRPKLLKRSSQDCSGLPTYRRVLPDSPVTSNTVTDVGFGDLVDDKNQSESKSTTDSNNTKNVEAGKPMSHFDLSVQSHSFVPTLHDALEEKPNSEQEHAPSVSQRIAQSEEIYRKNDIETDISTVESTDISDSEANGSGSDQ